MSQSDTSYSNGSGTSTNGDAISHTSNAYRSKIGLAVFDMDSTLIQQEVIALLAAVAGVEAQVSQITSRAMNGELDFSASLRERCRLLKGVRADIWESLKPLITITPGARELIRALRRRGVRTAVLSGGFMPLATWIKEELGMDHVRANTLEVSEDGTCFTGEVLGTIISGDVKRETTEELAKNYGLEPENVMCVGDGANDLPMMNYAGLGVAFNAKPRVQKLAPRALNGESLLDVLSLWGLTKEEIDELSRP